MITDYDYPMSDLRRMELSFKGREFEHKMEPMQYIQVRIVTFSQMFDTLIQFSKRLLSDFINLTQVHNFTVSAQDIFTFRRLSVFTVSFTRILQVLMQIMKRFPLYY